MWISYCSRMYQNVTMVSIIVMDRANKIFLIFLALVIISVIGFKYQQFFLNRNYTLLAEISCDPTTESCFKVICDGECEASAIVNSDGSPYKKVSILAAHAPACLEEENCTDFTCPVGDDTCSITYCSEDNLEEGEECVVPEPADDASSTTEETTTATSSEVATSTEAEENSL